MCRESERIVFCAFTELISPFRFVFDRNVDSDVRYKYLLVAHSSEA